MTQEKDRIPHLEFKPIRQLFNNEPQNFTTWLEQNLEVPSERPGIEFSLVQREKAVGHFSVDVLCEDSGRKPALSDFNSHALACPDAQ